MLHATLGKHVFNKYNTVLLYLDILYNEAGKK